MKQSWKIIVCLLLVAGCSTRQASMPYFNSRDIGKVVTHMTEIMVHDVTNPPLAARFFSYACLAGYEVVAQNNKDIKSMQGALNEFPHIQSPAVSNYSYQLAALLAMMETAKKIQPSGKSWEAYEQHFTDSCRQLGFSDEVMENSKQYATAVSQQILAYAKQDKYNRISNFARYTPLEKEGFWYPTPPAYMAAIEPYFMTIRPFTLDSCSQFKPAPPVPFSTDKQSDFYKLMLKNYKDTMPAEHRMIAAFWDCNPFAVQDNGHLMVGLKKISPGAHWMGITGAACQKAGSSFDETLQVYTSVAIGLMDGFICCWDEKYRSNRIRPETAIRQYIDPNWAPLLQTPPFPEYLSGHSTVSAASATILTHYFGDHFSFVDSAEINYGLPPRQFASFEAAAKEAAISRFYGGIHFMDAIENGYTQGQKVGAWVLQHLPSATGNVASVQHRQ